MDGAPRQGRDEGLFKGARGQKLYYQRCLPEGIPRAVIAIVRGAGEYQDLYSHMASALVPRGFAVYGFDHREHTRLPNQAGYLTEWSQSQDDVDAFVDLIAHDCGEHAIFLLGNGLGGLLVLTYALHHSNRLAGVAAFDPASAESAVEPLFTRVGRSISGFWPGPPAPSEVSPEPSGDVPGGAPTPHPFLSSIENQAPAPEGTDADVGELSLPHLIFRRVSGDGSVSAGSHDGAAHDRALSTAESWIEEHL